MHCLNSEEKRLLVAAWRSTGAAEGSAAAALAADLATLLVDCAPACACRGAEECADALGCEGTMGDEASVVEVAAAKAVVAAAAPANKVRSLPGAYACEGGVCCTFGCDKTAGRCAGNKFAPCGEFIG